MGVWCGWSSTGQCEGDFWALHGILISPNFLKESAQRKSHYHENVFQNNHSLATACLRRHCAKVCLPSFACPGKWMLAPGRVAQGSCSKGKRRNSAHLQLPHSVGGGFSDGVEETPHADPLHPQQLCQKLLLSTPFKSPFTTHRRRSGICWGFQPSGGNHFHRAH